MRGRDMCLSGGQWLARTAVRLAVVGIAFGVLAAAGHAQDDSPKVSDKPLTAEQLAVYRAVLADWMAREMPAMNLAIQTVPLGDTGPGVDDECGKDLDLEAASSVVHRFRQQDLAQMGPGRTFTLVDPDLQKKDVENNDPEKSIHEGKSVEDAVRNGFAHGLATLSEVRFDKKHQVAIVSYGFYCGGLCGNGGMVILEKKDGAWRLRSRCHEWISLLGLPVPAQRLSRPA
jgi:hypothetical protein